MANNRVKDEVFDWDTILNFQGETGPYIQYTYVRTKSIIEKSGFTFEDIRNSKEFDNISTENLRDKESQDILKLMYNFEDVLIQVTDKNEPSVLSRYLINVAKTYSGFYNNNKVIVEDEKVKKVRIFLTYMVNKILEIGGNLLGIQMPEKM